MIRRPARNKFYFLYVFINTKQILREMLAEDEMDVYWQDDTHWSWKAQQRVVDYMMEKLNFAKT